MFFINDEEKETILDFSQEIVRTRFPLWGDPPHYPKNWLVPPHVSPLFCPKYVDVVLFMQFLAILPKLSPHKSTPVEKPWYCKFILLY